MTCLHYSSPVKYNVVSHSILEKRFDEIEEHIEHPEAVTAFKIRLIIGVFCSRLIISRRERAVAKDSFGEMAAGSQVPGKIK